MANDLRETIKGERKSHLSLDVEKDAEFHLRLDDLSITPVQKKMYYVCYPVQCVSDAEKGKASNGEDIEMARFVQMGKPNIHTDSNSNDTDAKVKKVADKVRR